MKTARFLTLFLTALGLAWACAFDNSLREYLSIQFWFPFAKKPSQFERPNVQRISAPFAGMDKAVGDSPLARVRAAYQEHNPNGAKQHQALAEADADKSLTPREREEVSLLDAKFDMRSGSAERPKLWASALKKLSQFLHTAKSPDYLSEARGWLAHIHYLRGEQTEAGKIYLDELNRDGSNLSSETLVTSLRMTYGYDGGPELEKHLEEYFDTPEHAAFAIKLVTNPHWKRLSQWDNDNETALVTAPPPYQRIKDLLEKHRDLLRSETGSNALAMLSMRTALRAADPAAAQRFVSQVPSSAAIRSDPDFLWMLASIRFLTRNYAAAESPLLRLFRSQRASEDQKAAAAYALCGVYEKTLNRVEQIRFALWLYTQLRLHDRYLSVPSEIEDQSVYWASSGWDLQLLLDSQAPLESLRAFLSKYPNVPDTRLVRYSLAVRLARQHQYPESAQIYQALNVPWRAARMRELATLSATQEQPETKFKIAQLLSTHNEGVFWNDELWRGLQRYALQGSARDSRLTRAEHTAQAAADRKLKDDQEELWQAYLILREVVRQAGHSDLGRKAARLAVEDLRRISERFGRETEIRAADIELSKWLAQR